MANRNGFPGMIPLFAAFAFAIATATAGCDTAATAGPGTAARAGAAGATGAEINAEAAAIAGAEGIRIGFERVPPETARIFVHIMEWGEGQGMAEIGEITSSFADIRGASLEETLKTGEAFFPFVRSGRKYRVSAHFEKEGRLGADGGDESSEWAFAECVAAGGVYFDRGVELALNENRTAVALSAEPVFSADAVFAPNKYRYCATIQKEGQWSIGVGDNLSGKALTWNFEPFVREDIAASGYLESGEYSAYITAYCNVVSGSIAWSVEIARTEEFAFSL